MHGHGRGGVHFADYILIYGFGHERHEGRGNADEFSKASVKRHICRLFVLVHAVTPEAIATSSDIPVGQLVRVVAYRARAFGDFVLV